MTGGGSVRPGTFPGRALSPGASWRPPGPELFVHLGGRAFRFVPVASPPLPPPPYYHARPVVLAQAGRGRGQERRQGGAVRYPSTNVRVADSAGSAPRSVRTPLSLARRRFSPAVTAPRRPVRVSAPARDARNKPPGAAEQGPKMGVSRAKVCRPGRARKGFVHRGVPLRAFRTLRVSRAAHARCPCYHAPPPPPATYSLLPCGVTCYHARRPCTGTTTMPRRVGRRVRAGLPSRARAMLPMPCPRSARSGSLGCVRAVSPWLGTPSTVPSDPVRPRRVSVRSPREPAPSQGIAIISPLGAGSFSRRQGKNDRA